MNGNIIISVVVVLAIHVRTQPMSITITGDPKTGTTTVQEGDSIGFICRTNITVHVLKLVKTLPGNVKHVVKSVNNTDVIEHYFPANRDDNKANYNCWVPNPANSARPYRSHGKWYIIHFNASVITMTVNPLQEQYTYLQNTNVSLSCQSDEGNPTPEIVWTKNSKIIDPTIYLHQTNSARGNRYKAEYTTSAIFVETTLELNQQTFSCHIKHKEAVVENYQMDIAFPPDTSSLQILPNSMSGIDEWHSLQCTVSGSNPPSSIEWFLDGTKLTGKESGIKITSQQHTPHTRYHSRGIEATIEVLVEKERSGQTVECQVKYNDTYSTYLKKSYILTTKEPDNIYMYIGAGIGGGTVIIVIFITVCIICSYKKRKQKDKVEEPSNEERYEYIIESSNLSYDKNKDTPKNKIALKHQESTRENDYLQSVSSFSDTYTTSGIGLKSLSTIDLTDLISSGDYATVKYGRPKLQSGLKLDQPLVAKILKGNAKIHYRQILQSQLQALYIIKTHENVLEFTSFVDNKKCLALITNYYEAGDLLQFLRNQNTGSNVSARDLIGMARDVANGMTYLTSHQPPFLHHQLSASHVLVGPRLVCKVFGFASESSVQERDRWELKYKLPVDIRWKAPELLLYTQEHSVQSDVWSFGVLMYEAASLGNAPYPGLSGDSAIKSYVLDHQTMTRPVFVSSKFYDVMRHCWSWDPYNRPSFSALTSELDHLQTDTQLHIDINTLMHPSISGYMRVSDRHHRRY